MSENKPTQPTGPKPERVKIKGDWQKAIGKALKKKRPAEGWPEDEKEKRDAD